MPTLRQKARVFYIFRPLKEGEPPFADVRLPSGILICRVDEALHRKALGNAGKLLKERFGPR